MSLNLWIPVAWQYGELAPVAGRHGALRQAIIQAIKTHLFAEEPSRSPLGVSIGEVLLAFAANLSQPLSPRTRDSVRALWAALFPSETPAATQAEQAPPDPPATQDGAALPASPALVPDPEQPSGVVELPLAVGETFCLAMHGLCTALALAWLGAKPDTLAGDDDQDEDAGDEEDEERAAPVTVGRPTLAPRVEYYSAISAIAHWVRLAAWRQRHAQTEDFVAREEDTRLIAAILLDALLGACGGAFAVITGETVSQDGKPRTRKWIQPSAPALVKGIGNLLAELPTRFTVQPLKQPVAYQPQDEEPAADQRSEHFQVELIGYRRQNQFLRRVQAGLQSAEHRSDRFAGYLRAINLQQAVAWRINQPLLAVVRQLNVLAADAEAHPEAWGAAPDETLTGPAAADRSALRAWVLERLYTPVPAGERKTIKRPAEFLDSPLARQALAELCPVGAEPPPFYLAWKADYRGRIYAETPWLTPQGGDLQRALLEFAQGRVLDESGVAALRRHGANLVRRNRLLADLGIADRQVVTLAERERWVREHEDEILASAAAPLACSFWRVVAGKPMQFLAFCLAYHQWRRDPDAPIHLPVQIDGTCNGLQHIAALTGEVGLARAVNVLPREDGLPGDIYSELALAATAGLGHLEASNDPLHEPGLELADRWLTATPARRGWINRDTAKKVVMTIPYGAGATAQARYVLEAIAADFEREWRTAPPEVLATWLLELDLCLNRPGEDAAMQAERRSFVIECTRISNLFKEQRHQAFAAQDERERTQARAHWELMRTLAAYAALAIVHHLRAALSDRYPAVDAFSRWLRQVARACEGLPLLWLSPCGFPVCQDKFRLQGSSLNSRLGNREIRVDLKRLDEIVTARGQRDALLPNLIHSLDATHLAMTLLSAARRGVRDLGTIHDCLLCHPNDAQTLGEAVRQTFVDLYGPDGTNGAARLTGPLVRWQEWMGLLAELKDCREPAMLLGALNEPGGMGERLLRWWTPPDEAAQRRHAGLLALLDRLRQLDPPSQFMARQVLEYLQEHKVDERRNQHFPVAPFGQCLPLARGPGGGGELSPYFFS